MVPQLARAMIILQHQLYLHLIVRLLVLGDFPFTLPREAMLGQGTGIGELRKHDGYSAADGITGSEGGGFAHEEGIDSTRWNPGRGVTAVQIDLGRPARRVGKDDPGHSVSAGFNARRHDPAYRLGRPGGVSLLNTSRLIWMNSFRLPGTSSSGKIAVTGHSGSQAPQSMHSSGWMYSCSGPS